MKAPWRPTGRRARRPSAIATLEIENFRGLRRVRLAGLGRADLLTGPPSIDKWSVLEAFRLPASRFVLVSLHELLRGRGAVQIRPGAAETRSWPEGTQALSTLFFGFPRPGFDWTPIRVAARVRNLPLELVVGVGWLARRREPLFADAMARTDGIPSGE